VAAQLLDVFGFVSVLLRALSLALSALTAGGALFIATVLAAGAPDPERKPLWQSCSRLLRWSAVALCLVELCWLAADSAMLSLTAGLSLADVAGANFFRAGVAGACAAATIACLTVRPRQALPILLAASAIVLGALTAGSHAASRMENRLVLLPLTFLHQGATAAWVGGLPYLALSISRSPKNAAILCGRFSRLALAAVGTLFASGLCLSFFYVGAPAAVYGTAYGAMVVCKALLLLPLLLLGAFNFRIVRQPIGRFMTLLTGLRRFAEAEIGIGFTVILAAASLTSQPPAVDLVAGRVTAAEIVQRMHPTLPSLETPPLADLSPATPLAPGAASGPSSYIPGAPTYRPSTPADIAWSEYNHHWAGLIVLAVGLLAALANSGAVRWARHWPLLFLGLAAFLFLRADPENWPLGPRGFWESFQVSEVLQHRLFVRLILAFAVFEWGVRNGRITAPWASMVFPGVCAAGGALLLTHTHSLANIKEELLAELSHIPLAILAVLAGWSRWLELRLPPAYRRAPAWIWPVCFVLIGAVLLNYREA
jgi:putative copper resistance protein D